MTFAGRWRLLAGEGDQPAKILEIETHDPRYAVHQAMPATSRQTGVKVVGGYGTSVDPMLAMAFTCRRH